MTKTHEYFPVQFRIYSNFTHGKNKGKPNPETFHTLTLMRLIDYNNHANTESVGQTLKRAKTMIDEAHTKLVLTNPGKETDWEREARYVKQGLEVVSDGPVQNDRNQQSRVEAGDETMIAPIASSESEATAISMVAA